MAICITYGSKEKTVEQRTIGRQHPLLDDNWQSVVKGLIDISKKYDDTAPKKKSNYRQLQAECKALGIKASGSAACLENRLVRHAQGALTDADYSKSKTKAKKEKPSDTFGLSYRQAQRLVKWCKENVVGVDNLPLVRNSGWENVLMNVAFLCTTEHFRAIMATKGNRKELTDYIGAKSQTYLDELGV